MSCRGGLAGERLLGCASDASFYGDLHHSDYRDLPMQDRDPDVATELGHSHASVYVVQPKATFLIISPWLKRLIFFIQTCRSVHAFKETANGSGSVWPYSLSSLQEDAGPDPIGVAVAMGKDLTTIKQLMVSGADPNTLSYEGYTPLYQAAHGEQQPFLPQIRQLYWYTTGHGPDRCLLAGAVISMNQEEDGQEPVRTTIAFAPAK